MLNNLHKLIFKTVHNIKHPKNRFFIAFFLSFILHTIVIFPYFPSKELKNKPQLISLTEVTLYKKPPPKKKIIKKIVKKKATKPKPKEVKTPPKEIIEPEIEPTPVYDNLVNTKPVYPKIAIQRNWQGTCILELEVLTDGTVGSIKLLKTSGRKLLDQSAIRAVRFWKFTPATKKGKNIKSKLKVPIEYKLE